eukprot:NODE_7_length_67686_cov_1.621421.p11 type:complete len:394 gc:universal NODE_7_length_67686_cov_1.621421:47792-48973(+)
MASNVMLMLYLLSLVSAQDYYQPDLKVLQSVNNAMKSDPDFKVRIENAHIDPLAFNHYTFIEGTKDWPACNTDENPREKKTPIFLIVQPNDVVDLSKLFTKDADTWADEFENSLKSFRWRGDDQVKHICGEGKEGSAESYTNIFNKEMMPITLNVNNDEWKNDRMNLNFVLDVDETLVHRRYDPEINVWNANAQYTKDNPHVTVKDDFLGCTWVTFMNPEKQLQTICTTLREGAHEMIKELDKKVFLYVWTMSNRDRTEKVLGHFDLRKYFHDLITHENLTPNPKLPEIQMKAIQKLFTLEKFNFQNTFHVDDRTGPFILNQLNGIRVGQYLGSIYDTQLLQLKQVFKWMILCFDITLDIQKCIAHMKVRLPGVFDGYNPKENAFEKAHEPKQ